MVRPFLEGLLPDNNAVLESWDRRFQVSARNPFALLRHMGEDCAGAAQFVRPDRFEALSDPSEDEVNRLTEEAVAERLRDLEGFDINEHLCLRLASELGLRVAESTVRSFAGQDALVVERYDRQRLGEGRLIRIHQEDTCQALAISPYRKYQNEGGPGAADIVGLLLRESDDPGTDVGAFLDSLAMNWVIGGTDAHAKNYSLLLSAGSVRLAPLYDLISILPYPNLVHYREAKLSMSVDHEYHLWKIRRRHWEGLAVRCDLDPKPVVERVTEVIAAVPGAVERAAAAVRKKGIDHEVVDRLEAEIRDQSERCLRNLA